MEETKLIKRESPIQTNTGVWASRQSAEFLLKAICENPYRNYLVPSFVATVCAGIEGEINTAYIDYFHSKFGKKYVMHIKPYLFMKLTDRITQLPLVLSAFTYELNTNDQRVKEILDLFEYRNRLVHVKHMWHYADVYEDKKNGRIMDIKYHDEHHPDPYREWRDTVPNEKKLKRFMWLYNQFIPKFNNLASKFRRKNFNPEGWFLKIKKT
ncbi:MAG: hypothetical protein Tsb0026_06420 [Sulfuricaulis sp.]